MAYKKKLAQLMMEIELQKASAAHARRASKHIRSEAAHRSLLTYAERVEDEIQRLEAQAATLRRATSTPRRYLLAATQSFRRIAGFIPKPATGDGATTDYRLCLVDEKGAIQAREEFIAPKDDVALLVADMVYRACSDSCHSYELWQFDRRLRPFNDPQANTVIVPSDQQTFDIQQITLNLEETLQRSHWHIARSERLIAEAQRLKERIRVAK